MKTLIKNSVIQLTDHTVGKADDLSTASNTVIIDPIIPGSVAETVKVK